MPKGFFEARALLKKHRARAVVGVGGYVTVPVLMAARSLGIPTLIHESNARPGVANRFLNRFATRTAVGLAAANAHLRRAGVVTGTPVRREFFEIPPFDPNAATRRLLVFGGSQGSRVINRAMARAAVLLEKSGLEVVHQTGEKDLTGHAAALHPGAGQLEARAVPAEALGADGGGGPRALARRRDDGVGARRGRPALDPRALRRRRRPATSSRTRRRSTGPGASIVIDEKDFEAESLAGTIAEIMKDRARLTAMAQKAKSLARPNAAADLARLLFEAEATR